MVNLNGCIFDWNELLKKYGICNKVSVKDCNWTQTHNSNPQPQRLVWPNGWVVAYELSGCRFDPVAVS